MDDILSHLWWLKSKKVWAFIIGVVTLSAAAFQVEPFPYADFTTKLVALIIGFMGSNAVEDGMKARAASNATTTTVSTPGGSDVTVVAPPDHTGTPPQPFISRTGL